MSMIINQEFMTEHVIKPMEAKFKDIEAKLWLIKNDVKYIREQVKEEKEKKEKEEKKVK